MKESQFSPQSALKAVLLLLLMGLAACIDQPTVDTSAVTAAVQTAVAEMPTADPVVVEVTRIVEVTRAVEIIREVEVTRLVEVAATEMQPATPQATDTAQGYEITATEVLSGLLDAGLPVGDHVAYTDESDPNELLARPGQYTSKVNFLDTRLEEEFGNFEPGDGGSIEVFPDSAGATGRSEYLQSIGQIFSPAAEYHYIEENVLLRLSHRLLPEQAEAYGAAFRELLTGSEGQ